MKTPTSEKYNSREQGLFDQICERDETIRHQDAIRREEREIIQTRIDDMSDRIGWMTDRVATATFWMKLRYLFGGKL